MCFNILQHLFFFDITSLLKDKKSEKKWKHILYIYKKINNSVVTLENKFKIMVKSDDTIERNKLSVIGCWLNNTSLFWQITIHWNSGYIEAHRMKKFIFFDIVSFALCLESLILQQGADSSMVDGKFIGFRINIIKVNKNVFDNPIAWALNYHITLFLIFRGIPGRHKFEFVLRLSLDIFYEPP